MVKKFSRKSHKIVCFLCVQALWAKNNVWIRSEVNSMFLKKKICADFLDGQNAITTKMSQKKESSKVVLVFLPRCWCSGKSIGKQGKIVKNEKLWTIKCDAYKRLVDGGYDSKDLRHVEVFIHPVRMRKSVMVFGWFKNWFFCVLTDHKTGILFSNQRMELFYKQKRPRIRIIIIRFSLENDIMVVEFQKIWSQTQWIQQSLQYNNDAWAGGFLFCQLT